MFHKLFVQIRKDGTNNLTRATFSSRSLHTKIQGEPLLELERRESFASTFLELAIDRFEARNDRQATPVDENWTFDELQLQVILQCVVCVALE